jgi:hypothetical protein
MLFHAFEMQEAAKAAPYREKVGGATWPFKNGQNAAFRGLFSHPAM